MAVIGLMMLVIALRRDRTVPPTRRVIARPIGLFQVAALVFLILYPLGIPTSWTAENIAQKREGSLHSDSNK